MVDVDSQLARTVLGDNLNVRKGEAVLIESWTHSLPLARKFVSEVRRLGGRPTLLHEDEEAWWEAVEKRQFDLLGKLSDAERAALEKTDVYVYFWGPADRPRMAALPDAVQEKLTAWNEGWYDIAQKHGVRGTRMMVAQATEPAAKEFGLDADDWRKRMTAAGTVSGKQLAARGTRVMKALAKGSELRVRHPNGTDLTVQLKGIKSRTDSGVVTPEAMKRRYGMLSNTPSGQVLSAVDKASAQGTFVSNRTVYLGAFRFGGQTWKFQDGKLVEHSTKIGGEMFDKNFASAPKGADVLGYFSIGLNPKSEDLPPIEDTEEGSMIIGIGGNQFVGGKSKMPFQGFALIGGATIEVDGKVLAKGGKIK